MLTSVIVSVLVLTTGILWSAGRRPPSALQPATAAPVSGGGPRRLRSDLSAAVGVDDEEEEANIVMDSLRALGLVRHRVDRPVVGRKAYVRQWERVRALIVLAGIVLGLGVALAATVGIIVLGTGFLLEQAIS